MAGLHLSLELWSQLVSLLQICQLHALLLRLKRHCHFSRGTCSKSQHQSFTPKAASSLTKELRLHILPCHTGVLVIAMRHVASDHVHACFHQLDQHLLGCTQAGSILYLNQNR